MLILSVKAGTECSGCRQSNSDVFVSSAVFAGDFKIHIDMFMTHAY
jgi:hypothetical protein